MIDNKEVMKMRKFLISLIIVLGIITSTLTNSFSKDQVTVAYVMSKVDGLLTEIETQTLKITKYPDVYKYPVVDVINFDSKSQNLYVAGSYGAGIAKLNADTWKVVKRVEEEEIGINTYHGLYLSPDGKKIITAALTDQPTTVIIDAEKLTIEKQFGKLLGDQPGLAVFSKNGRYLYTVMGMGKIYVINLATNTIEKSIILPEHFGFGENITMGPSADKLYITTSNYKSGQVALIAYDLYNDKFTVVMKEITGTFISPPYSRYLYIHQWQFKTQEIDNKIKRLLVSTEKIKVIDLTNYKIVKNIVIPDYDSKNRFIELTLSPDGKRLFGIIEEGYRYPAYLVIFDSMTGRELKRVEIGFGATNIVFGQK